MNKFLDVQESVGEHCISFTFEFDGELYHFSRSNIDYKHVIRCDKGYNPLPEDDQMTVDDYCAFLAEKYGTEVEAGLKWRGVVAPYIRVWKRDTLDESRPLRAAKNEKAEYAIKKYMQFFGKYASVEAQTQQAKAVEDEKDALKTLKDYKHIWAAKNKTEYEANEKQREVLKHKEQEFTEQSNKGLLVLDSFQVRHFSELEISHVSTGDRRQRYRPSSMRSAGR